MLRTNATTQTPLVHSRPPLRTDALCALTTSSAVILAEIRRAERRVLAMLGAARMERGGNATKGPSRGGGGGRGAFGNGLDADDDDDDDGRKPRLLRELLPIHLLDLHFDGESDDTTDTSSSDESSSSSSSDSSSSEDSDDDEGEDIGDYEEEEFNDASAAMLISSSGSDVIGNLSPVSRNVNTAEKKSVKVKAAVNRKKKGGGAADTGRAKLRSATAATAHTSRLHAEANHRHAKASMAEGLGRGGGGGSSKAATPFQASAYHCDDSALRSYAAVKVTGYMQRCERLVAEQLEFIRAHHEAQVLGAAGAARASAVREAKAAFGQQAGSNNVPLPPHSSNRYYQQSQQPQQLVMMPPQHNTSARGPVNTSSSSAFGGGRGSVVGTPNAMMNTSAASVGVGSVLVDAITPIRPNPNPSPPPQQQYPVAHPASVAGTPLMSSLATAHPNAAGGAAAAHVPLGGGGVGGGANVVINSGRVSRTASSTAVNPMTPIVATPLAATLASGRGDSSYAGGSVPTTPPPAPQQHQQQHHSSLPNAAAVNNTTAVMPSSVHQQQPLYDQPSSPQPSYSYGAEGASGSGSGYPHHHHNRALSITKEQSMTANPQQQQYTRHHHDDGSSAANIPRTPPSHIAHYADDANGMDGDISGGAGRMSTPSAHNTHHMNMMMGSAEGVAYDSNTNGNAAAARRSEAISRAWGQLAALSAGADGGADATGGSASTSSRGVSRTADGVVHQHHHHDGSDLPPLRVPSMSTPPRDAVGGDQRRHSYIHNHNTAPSAGTNTLTVESRSVSSATTAVSYHVTAGAVPTPSGSASDAHYAQQQHQHQQALHHYNQQQQRSVSTSSSQANAMLRTPSAPPPHLGSVMNTSPLPAPLPMSNRPSTAYNNNRTMHTATSVSQQQQPTSNGTSLSSAAGGGAVPPQHYHHDPRHVQRPIHTAGGQVFTPSFTTNTAPTTHGGGGGLFGNGPAAAAIGLHTTPPVPMVTSARARSYMAHLDRVMAVADMEGDADHRGHQQNHHHAF